MHGDTHAHILRQNRSLVCVVCGCVVCTRVKFFGFNSKQKDFVFHPTLRQGSQVDVSVRVFLWVWLLGVLILSFNMQGNVIHLRRRKNNRVEKGEQNNKRSMESVVDSDLFGQAVAKERTKSGGREHFFFHF